MLKLKRRRAGLYECDGGNVLIERDGKVWNIYTLTSTLPGGATLKQAKEKLEQLLSRNSSRCVT